MAQTHASSEPIDYNAIYTIKDEGFQRSQVMETVSYLTDVYGPRLTGSPNIKQAADWAVAKLREWGASNPRVEKWGTFGRGWVNERFNAQVLTPTPWPIIGIPKAWTPGLAGPITADVIFAPMESEKDFDTWRGKLKGKIVMPMPTREVKPLFEAQAKRYTEKDLEEIEQLEPATAAARRRSDPPPFQFSRKRMEFLVNEGVLATFEPGRGDGGTLFVQQGGAYSSTPPTGPYARTFPASVPPQIVIAVEHYGRLARTLDKKVPVTVALDVQNTLPGRSAGIQHPRRNAGHRQGRRDRDARRPLRLVARGHGRHRQRRRLRDDARGDAHPEGLRSARCAARCAWRSGAARSRGCSARGRM